METDNLLWRFSNTIYSREGVSKILLYAQNKYLIDINMILYTAWLASINRSLTVEDIRAAEKLVKPWRTEIIVPIRKVRRSLKKTFDKNFLLESVRKLEIDAEKEQLRILYDSFLELSSDQPSSYKLKILKDNLTVYCNIYFFDKLITDRIKNRLAIAMGLAHESDEE